MRMLRLADVAGVVALIVFSAGFFSWSAQAGEIEQCVGCHDVVNKGYLHEAIVIGDTMMGGCSICHEPDHDKSTGFAKRLKKKGNDLCLQCHKDSALVKGKGHPYQGHPVIGWRDPLYPEKKFTCVSCHNPHSSSQPHLFRYRYGKYTPYRDECNVCHNDTTGGSNVPGPLPVPPWSE